MDETAFAYFLFNKLYFTFIHPNIKFLSSNVLSNFHDHIRSLQIVKDLHIKNNAMFYLVCECRTSTPPFQHDISSDTNTLFRLLIYKDVMVPTIIDRMAIVTLERTFGAAGLGSSTL